MRRLVDDAAIAALDAPTLVPPPRPASFPDGPTAELRDAMARFTTDDDHTARRRSVEAAIASVDVELLTREVRERSRIVAESDRPVDALIDIGLHVPTRALLAALGVDRSDVDGSADDVRSIVGVIGRGEELTPAVEAATRRLTSAFATHPEGPVAVVSMLYQNHDATAALFGSVLLARTTGALRPNALARTVRTATVDTRVGDTDGDVVTAGEEVEVSLDGDGVEFGAGVHACPGQALAVAIVDAMVSTLDDFDRVVDPAAVVCGTDGRATALPLSD